MILQQHRLQDGRELLAREACGEDAGQLLEYVHAVCAETEFLTFGPGEFELSERDEIELLEKYRASENQIFILGLIESEIVSTVHFSAGQRPRIRHVGEFGMSVRQSHWGAGIGSRMLQTLIDWAKKNNGLAKINLRVRTDNQRAMALYTRNGFQLEGTLTKAMFISGQYYDEHCMGLEV